MFLVGTWNNETVDRQLRQTTRRIPSQIDSIIILLHTRDFLSNKLSENVHRGSGSSKVALDKKGKDSTIFRVLEKVHECPARDLGAGNGSPLFSLYFPS